MIPSLMILTGSLIILALAGYWMRRAAKAEQRVAELNGTIAEMRSAGIELCQIHNERNARLYRIEALETPSMAHVGKVAVAIAKGER